MDSAVNSFFAKIFPNIENSDLLNEAVVIDELRKDVVSCLARIEAEDTGFWWKDKELISLFTHLHECGVITLPKDPVEKLRWIAFLCLEMSKIEGFDCGNVVLPPDFMPDDFFEMWEDEYGSEVIDEIKKIQTRLAKEGWDEVFPK